MRDYDTPPNHIRYTDHDALRRPRPSQTSGADRDLALLRAAVPAGAQRKGLNVECTRHNTLPEVPRQIPCREDVAPLPAFPRPVRERHDAVSAAILERVDTTLTHLERRQVAIRPIRRRIKRNK